MVSLYIQPRRRPMRLLILSVLALVLSTSAHAQVIGTKDTTESRQAMRSLCRIQPDPMRCNAYMDMLGNPRPSTQSSRPRPRSGPTFRGPAPFG